MVASSNRLLITSLTQLFDGIGPLVGAATSQDAALECLGGRWRGAADLHRPT